MVHVLVAALLVLRRPGLVRVETFLCSVSVTHLDDDSILEPRDSHGVVTDRKVNAQLLLQIVLEHSSLQLNIDDTEAPGTLYHCLLIIHIVDGIRIALCNDNRF